MSKIKYKTQDPLFLDPKLKKLEGGIFLKAKSSYILINYLIFFL